MRAIARLLEDACAAVGRARDDAPRPGGERLASCMPARRAMPVARPPSRNQLPAIGAAKLAGTAPGPMGGRA